MGGVERYVCNLSKKLIAKEHAVTVVTSNVLRLPDRENFEGIPYALPQYAEQTASFSEA